MAGLKSLAKDTAIYGMSSIIGRFLNYLLVPLYTAKLSVESGGYGVITNIYALTALFLIILTYGMETGFFRFINDQKEKAMTVYSTTLLSVGSTSILFIILCLLFSPSIAGHFGYNPSYIQMMAVVVALDAFQCIPFAYLRYRKRPIKFAALKLLFILSNIVLNLAFFVWFPAIYQKHPEWISWIYSPAYGVGYVFLANLICTSAITFCFIKELTGFPYIFDKELFKRMLRYSFPILFLGIAGILNQSVDKIIYPLLFTDKAEASIQLGIYGAASKIAMIMALLTQAFRYAYEPFVFGKSQDKDNRQIYANVMKFFIIFTLLAFLGVMFYLDILRYIIAPDYWVGLKVVPIVMAGSLCMGIYFNLSFWYKLIDKTMWGVYFSLVGCILVIGLNVAFVPTYGYMASAWAGLTGFFVVMVLSYVVGQKQYPIHYDLNSIGKYVLLAAILYIAGMYIPIENLPLKLLFRTLLLLIFIIYTLKKDFPIQQLPIINRYIKNNIMAEQTQHAFALKRFLKEYLDLKKDKANELETVDSIKKGVEFKGANLWILIFAIFMASLGLNVNSTAVIIGAMLISPLMGPIMGVGLSVGLNDFELMKRSLKSFLITTTFSVITATIYFMCTPLNEAQSELLARTSPTIYDVFIALMGGLAGVVALSTKEKGNVIPGVAIATALMPPLCTAGYGLATGNLLYFLGAFYLYFINSVFISLATFIGVRVMHFTRKEFVDKAREKTVKKYIIIIVVLTMCPAIYLTYGIVKTTLYEAAANNFINKELDFPDTQVLDRTISYEKKEIKVILVGDEVPENLIAMAKDKLKEYKLPKTKLIILQGMNNEGIDVSSVRAMVMEDFYKNSEQRLQEQQQKISKLEKNLKTYQECDAETQKLSPELKVLYPNAKSVSLARAIRMEVDSNKVDTVSVAIMQFSKNPSLAERKKITEWLKARLKVKKLQLIIE